jgi:cytochrome c-type biogenesis protein CcmF
MLSWKRAALWPALTRLWWAAVAALLIGAWAAFGGARLIPALALAAAGWIIFGAFSDVVERIRLFRVPLANSLSRLAGLPRSAFGAALAHAGMGVTLAGLAGMSMASDTIALVKPGASTDLAGYRFTLTDLHDAAGPNYAARVATVRVTRDGAEIATLAPERRSFVVQRMTTTEAKIHTDFLRVIYVVLGEERDGAAVLRLHHNPLAPWIWLGALVMAAGGFLSLSDRRLRVGAPLRRTAALPAASGAATGAATGA